MRARLTAIAKKAEEEQIEIFLEFKNQYEQRKEADVFKQYVQDLPFPDCHEALVDFKGEAEGSENEQRQALLNALDGTIGDDREGWIELAEDFCKKITFSSQNHSSPKPSNSRNKRISDRESVPISEEETNEEEEVTLEEEDLGDQSIRTCKSTVKSSQNHGSGEEMEH